MIGAFCEVSDNSSHRSASSPRPCSDRHSPIATVARATCSYTIISGFTFSIFAVSTPGRSAPSIHDRCFIALCGYPSRPAGSNSAA